MKNTCNRRCKALLRKNKEILGTTALNSKTQNIKYYILSNKKFKKKEERKSSFWLLKVCGLQTNTSTHPL